MARELEEKEYARLMDKYPDEFAALYAEEIAKLKPPFTRGEFGKQAAEANALVKLKAKHGFVK
jgi:hypothetical protein